MLFRTDKYQTAYILLVTTLYAFVYVCCWYSALVTNMLGLSA